MTTTPEAAAPAHPSLEAAREFVARVRALDRGELAALKRNAGRTLGEARGVMWFYRLLDPRDRWNPEIAFLVATLMGLNQHEGIGNFGKSMRELARRHNADSVDRRFRILLDSQFGLVDGRRPGGGELAYRLRQIVKLAASKEVGVDWPQLLADLRQWTHPDKWVQRKWAESFYAPYERDAAAAEVETDEVE